MLQAFTVYLYAAGWHTFIESDALVKVSSSACDFRLMIKVIPGRAVRRNNKVNLLHLLRRDLKLWTL